MSADQRWQNIRIWSEPSDFRRRRAVGIFSERSDGSEWMAKPLEFVEVTNRLIEHDGYSVPSAMGGEVLQAFLDHAWSIGMRPAGFSDVPLQVGAMKEHLNDMRAIAFGVIGRPMVAGPISDADIAAMRGPGALKEKPFRL